MEDAKPAGWGDCGSPRLLNRCGGSPGRFARSASGLRANRGEIPPPIGEENLKEQLHLNPAVRSVGAPARIEDADGISEHRRYQTPSPITSPSSTKRWSSLPQKRLTARSWSASMALGPVTSCFNTCARRGSTSPIRMVYPVRPLTGLGTNPRGSSCFLDAWRSNHRAFRVRRIIRRGRNPTLI